MDDLSLFNQQPTPPPTKTYADNSIRAEQAKRIRSAATPEPRARKADPETSHEAAASVRAHTITQTKEAILDTLAALGPVSDERIFLGLVERGIATSLSGARTRRSELVRAGAVVFAQAYETTRSGRRTRLWCIVAVAGAS